VRQDEQKRQDCFEVNAQGHLAGPRKKPTRWFLAETQLLGEKKAAHDQLRHEGGKVQLVGMQFYSPTVFDHSETSQHRIV
jgi:hypothetical protein